MKFRYTRDTRLTLLLFLSFAESSIESRDNEVE